MCCDSRSVLPMAWVRLDVTSKLGAPRMTDFNNSTGVEPIGPLTSSHKRKNLHSFHSQAKETSSWGKHFWVFSMTTTANTHTPGNWQLGWKVFTFTFSSILQFTLITYTQIKLPRKAAGSECAGSHLRGDNYPFVNSKIAALRHQWTCALGAKDKPQRRGEGIISAASQKSLQKLLKSDGQHGDRGDSDWTYSHTMRTSGTRVWWTTHALNKLILGYLLSFWRDIHEGSW